MAWLVRHGHEQNGGLQLKDSKAFKAHLNAYKAEAFGFREDDELGYSSGVPIPPPPHTVWFDNHAYEEKATVDTWLQLIYSFGGMLASEAAREVIERHDPSVHAFYPVEIDGWKVGPPPKQYYLVNIRSLLPALDVERAVRDGVAKTQDVPEITQPYRLYETLIMMNFWPKPEDPPKIFVKESAVKGKGLWVQKGFNTFDLFMSDALVADIAALEDGFGGYEPTNRVGVIP